MLTLLLLLPLLLLLRSTSVVNFTAPCVDKYLVPDRLVVCPLPTRSTTAGCGAACCLCWCCCCCTYAVLLLCGNTRDVRVRVARMFKMAKQFRVACSLGHITINTPRRTCVDMDRQSQASGIHTYKHQRQHAPGTRHIITGACTSRYPSIVDQCCLNELTRRLLELGSMFSNLASCVGSPVSAYRLLQLLLLLLSAAAAVSWRTLRLDSRSNNCSRIGCLELLLFLLLLLLLLLPSY